MNGLKILSITLLVMPLILVVPVMAALNTIPGGGTAFIGEQGLDITQTGAKSGSTIAWYSGSSNVGSGAPTATVVVDDSSSFYIAPSTFSGKTGAWYLFPQKSLAFYVQDPSLIIRIFDSSANFEVAGTVTWVPKGDSVSFGIDSNLYVMANRPGVSGAPVTIHIKAPDGAEYASVSGNSLVDIPVSTASYSTGPIWSTGSYSSGTYTVWAECNANGMNDNYGAVGKSQSVQKAMLLQSVNPLITSSLSPSPSISIGTGTTPVMSAVPTTVPVTTVPTTTSPPATTVTTPKPSSPMPTAAKTTIPPTTVPTTVPGPGILLAASGIAIAFLLVRRPGLP
ncbi:MAG TPA: DUF3821 domain-containing protein [Methanoregulaceae archaeon]|nr:DUF3821 domain-containing protein [Methanoregulaceae archaeon]